MPWASIGRASGWLEHLSMTSCRGKQAKLLGQIDLPITFGNPSNFRTEVLTFEVVGFHGTYHAILGCSCYMKFMVVPIYTYLKIKMPSPCGVTTIGTSFQRAYECEVECCELATTTIASEELAIIKEETAEKAPNSKQSARSFEPIEGTKEVLIDLGSLEERWCTSVPHFLPNRKACWSTSSA
jgi:hypothetical protein